MDTFLIVDMQNSFLHPCGGTYTLTGAPLVHIDRTIAAVRRLAEHSARAGVPILYTRPRRPPFAWLLVNREDRP